jgi:hypothetical protein
LRYHLTRVSSNSKLGPIPVVTSSPNTCPSTCDLKGAGCYAEHGPLAIHWRNVAQGGISIDQLCSDLQSLPRKQLWRYGQAGDLPQSLEDCNKLAKANRGRPVICFTHRRDLDTVNHMKAQGFHVNLSADNMEQADDFSAAGHSVVLVLPSEMGKLSNETISEYRKRMGGTLRRKTPRGQTIVVCPQTFLNNVTCSSCGICSRPRLRGEIIGFPAHGTRRKMVDRNINAKRRERFPVDDSDAGVRTSGT